MSHNEIDRDGMKVLVVSDMGARFDLETGLEIPRRSVENLEIVHASEIARYYGLDLGDVGLGDNRVLGTWSLVHLNLIGQRVAYNNDQQEVSDRYIRDWRVIKDSRGVPVDTKEIVKAEKQILDIDDGMYVRYADLVKFAKAQGWTPGGGWPAKSHAAPTVDIAAIVAAVMAAMNNQAEATGRSPKQRAHDAWMSAGKPEPRDEWKAAWAEDNG